MNWLTQHLAPDWLRTQMQFEWLDRYGPGVDDYRLPKSKLKREANAIVVGQDGAQLLQAVFASDALALLRTLPAIEMLRCIWI